MTNLLTHLTETNFLSKSIMIDKQSSNNRSYVPVDDQDNDDDDIVLPAPVFIPTQSNGKCQF